MIQLLHATSSLDELGTVLARHSPCQLPGRWTPAFYMTCMIFVSRFAAVFQIYNVHSHNSHHPALPACMTLRPHANTLLVKAWLSLLWMWSLPKAFARIGCRCRKGRWSVRWRCATILEAVGGASTQSAKAATTTNGFKRVNHKQVYWSWICRLSIRTPITPDVWVRPFMYFHVLSIFSPLVILHDLTNFDHIWPFPCASTTVSTVRQCRRIGLTPLRASGADHQISNFA